MVDRLIPSIREAMQRKKPLLLAIDGRCGSGKTTLAEQLAHAFDSECTVFHMDDFFLPGSKRTPERMAIPGENIDHERFKATVLSRLSDHSPGFTYQRYDCKTLTYHEVHAQSMPLYIVEGVYSLHPSLLPYYDLKIFLTVNRKEQERRILHRSNPEVLERFLSLWIPLEEKYFGELNVAHHCNWVIDTSEAF